MVTMSRRCPYVRSTGMSEVQPAGRSPEAMCSNDSRASGAPPDFQEGSGILQSTTFRGQAGASGVKEECGHSHYEL